MHTDKAWKVLVVALAAIVGSLLVGHHVYNNLKSQNAAALSRAGTPVNAVVTSVGKWRQVPITNEYGQFLYRETKHVVTYRYILAGKAIDRTFNTIRGATAGNYDRFYVNPAGAIVYPDQLHLVSGFMLWFAVVGLGALTFWVAAGITFTALFPEFAEGEPCTC